MVRNRIAYVFCLVASIAFYLVYSGWIALFLLLFVIVLPIGSLLLSLLPMTRSSVVIHHPSLVSLNEPAQLTVFQASNRILPSVPVQIKWKLIDEMAGTSVMHTELIGGTKSVSLPLDTSYVGAYTVEPCCIRVFDYFCLFAIRRPKPEPRSVIVFPVEVTPDPLPNFQVLETCSYRPKPGGGFSEAHELRSYRPGDPIRDIHWKLSAKTDQLIVREAQIPIISKRIVSFDFCGSREVLNNIFGQLLWMYRRLSERKITYELQWLEPSNLELQSVPISEERHWNDCIFRLLHTRCSAQIPSMIEWPQAFNDWRYHINAFKGDDNS